MQNKKLNFEDLKNKIIHFYYKNTLFVLIVVVPTFLAILYYGLFASDIYISESKFVIRNSEKRAISGIDTMLQATGIGSSNSEAYIVKDFILSRDSLDYINKKLNFKEIYSSSDISIFDRFNGFLIDGSFEALYQYYQKFIEVNIDPQSYIITIDTKAFDANSSKRINEELIVMSEYLVNKLNQRIMHDAIDLAEKEANASLVKFYDISSKLAKYRDTKSIFDPVQQSSLQMQLISKLQDELIKTKVNLSGLIKLAPQSPQINLLKLKIQNLENQIISETSKVVGGEKSLSKDSTEYDRLVLEKELASRQMAISFATLEQAKNEAIKKQLYLEKISNPNTPDYPLEPHRIKNIFTVFILSFIIWGILSMLISGIKEHNE